MEAKLCDCHGEPCYWQRDVRLTAGGRWECPVKRAAFNATRSTNPQRYEAINQRRRDKYDSDWRSRISSGLVRNEGRRRRNRERRKLLDEED